ncbi:hypothetical protein HDU91_003635, partial [Kappamyces sp. JEL0680]
MLALLLKSWKNGHSKQGAKSSYSTSSFYPQPLSVQSQHRESLHQRRGLEVLASFAGSIAAAILLRTWRARNDERLNTCVSKDILPGKPSPSSSRTSREETGSIQQEKPSPALASLRRSGWPLFGDLSVQKPQLLGLALCSNALRLRFDELLSQYRASEPFARLDADQPPSCSDSTTLHSVATQEDCATSDP